ncbi:hypothetical protein ME121_4970 [Methylobacterium sp. ME121]|jgi:hypothetical protein|nr:hypothetical protein CCS92_29370 [Methylobacterium radiotolerans]GAN50911.1 hypothetical protein ME121_4970 [Methylobacterium sp. ME121]
MSHFPTTRYADRTSHQVRTEIRGATSSEVGEEIEEERQVLDEQTERLRAQRLAQKSQEA